MPLAGTNGGAGAQVTKLFAFLPLDEDTAQTLILKQDRLGVDSGKAERQQTNWKDFELDSVLKFRSTAKKPVTASAAKERQ